VGLPTFFESARRSGIEVGPSRGDEVPHGREPKRLVFDSQAVGDLLF
jgi:hypothetical protein